ncbi:MAG: hypothetical protein AAF711_14855 [Planctomycetota bacterium]
MTDYKSEQPKALQQFFALAAALFCAPILWIAPFVLIPHPNGVFYVYVKAALSALVSMPMSFLIYKLLRPRAK